MMIRVFLCVLTAFIEKSFFICFFINAIGFIAYFALFAGFAITEGSFIFIIQSKYGFLFLNNFFDEQ